MDYKIWIETISKYKNQSIIIVDNNANLVYYYEPKSNFFDNNVPSENLIGKNILELIEDLKKEESTFYRVLETGKPIYDYIQTFINYAKKRVTAVSTTLPIIKNDKLVGALEILEDVNNYKKLLERVNEIERVDNKNKKYPVCDRNTGANFVVDDIIGNDPQMLDIKNKILKIADSVSSVMVYGETGTGKELVVQAIHNASFKRHDKPFIAQNCAAIPKDLLESILFGTTSGSFTGSKEKPGLFEIADGGTLLLDEINSMDLDLQAKLLRVLQTGEIMRLGGSRIIKTNVRVMATTNVEPLEAVKKGCIRQDLYYRLNVINLTIPPLRDRRGDIKILIKYYINIYNTILDKNIEDVSEDCMKYFLAYDWPGNIRELRYTIENIMSFTDNSIITVIDIPECIKNFNVDDIKKSVGDQNIIYPLNDTIKQVEVDAIKKALIATNGNQSKAAKLLEIPRQTLFNKIVKYGIKGSLVFKNDQK